MADHVDEQFLEAGPQLRIVSATLKGYDNIDVAACTRRGIWLTVLPHELSDAAADLAIGLMIGVMRRIREGDLQVRSGSHVGWRPRLYGTNLTGRTVGIIGMGAVGQALASRLEVFRAHILYSESASRPEDAGLLGSARRVPLADLLALSDVVVPLVPLNTSTAGMLGAAEIGQMPAGSYLINVSRGSVVDEEAVARALESGQLAGYAADVFALEDYALPGHPSAIPPALLGHPRTLFTPHLGTAADEVRLSMSLAAAGQVRLALAGHRPPYAVNDVAAGVQKWPGRSAQP
jgi:phosphonate dehydrogenase